MTDKERKAAENYKKYHIEAIAPYEGITVATSTNHDYKVVIMSDNSACLYCYAKPGSGCSDCHYCGTSTLKTHVQHLQNIRNRKQVFDKVIQPGFFAALGIQF